MMILRFNKIFICASVLLLMCIMTGCSDGIEPVYPNLVDLAPGSPGYEGNREVRGLRAGFYLVRHEKEQAHQEKNPVGEILIWHEEDWYALDGTGTIVKIASSVNDIPASFTNIPLTGAGKTNVIKGLTNGERYTVYAYGKMSNQDRIGRVNEGGNSDDARFKIATYSCNAFANLKGLSTSQYINMYDDSSPSPNFGSTNTSHVFDENNHVVVLVDTALRWTEFPQTIGKDPGQTLRLKGYTYDIEIMSLTQNNSADELTVAPVEKDGQRYLVLTGTRQFRGRITYRLPD